MSLLQDIRDELGRDGGEAAALATPDLRPLLAELLELGAQSTDPSRVDAWLEDEFRNWIEWGRLDTLAREIAQRVDVNWPDLPRPLAGKYVIASARAVLSGYLHLSQDPVPDESLAASRLAILRWIGKDALKAGNGTPSYRTRVKRYCREVGLKADGEVLTAGRVLLSLHGRDEVAWLLALEVSRAVSNWDEWRCSMELVRGLLERPKRRWDPHDDEVGPGLPEPTLERLRSLGVVSVVLDGPEGYPCMFNVTELGRDLLTELAAPQAPPTLLLARSLASDTTAQALRLAGPAGQNAGTATVELAIAEQARSLVHELRNKLVPLKGAMGIIAEALPPPGRSAKVNKAIDVAGRVVDDLFRYVDVTVELTKGLRAPPHWFDLAGALGDARTNGRNGNTDARVEVIGEPGIFEVYGPERVFVEAVGNLVRNAVQIVRDKAPHVALTIASDTETFTIDIDDNGPGVPASQRQRIFDSGVSMRDGGTGQGLFIVRQAMSRDFDASVVCLDGPGGGARFRVVIPGHRVRRVPEQGRTGDELQ